VNVNGSNFNNVSNIANIQTKLNKIYSQASINWNVSTQIQNITISFSEDGKNTFNCLPEDNMLYTQDMQQAINALGTTDPNTYYLFILPEADDPLIMGLMPYLQQYGFIFMNQCTREAKLVKTFAHELGHGAFGMEHEFFLYPEIQELDPNLMTWHLTDTQLHKYQWDWIQNPFCMIDGDCDTQLHKYQWDWIQNPFCMIDGDCGTGKNATMMGEGLSFFEADLSNLEIFHSVTGPTNLDCEIFKRFLHPSGQILTFPYHIYKDIDKLSFEIDENGVLLSFKIKEGCTILSGEYGYAYKIIENERVISSSYICFENAKDDGVFKTSVTLNSGENTNTFNNLDSKYIIKFTEGIDLMPCEPGIYVVTNYEQSECKEITEDDCNSLKTEAIFNSETACFLPTFIFNENVQHSYIFDNNITYINPANLPITLSNTVKVDFKSLTGIDEIDTYFTETGCVRSFIKDDVIYSGKFQKINESWKFLGYKNMGLGEDEFYIDRLSIELPAEYPLVYFYYWPTSNSRADARLINYNIKPESSNHTGEGNMLYQKQIIGNSEYLGNIFFSCNCNISTDDINGIHDNSGLPLSWEESEIVSSYYNYYENNGLLIHIKSVNSGKNYYIYRY